MNSEVGVGDARERAEQVEQIRSALRRLNPEFHRSDISWPALDALVERVEAAERRWKDAVEGRDDLPMAHDILSQLKAAEARVKVLEEALRRVLVADRARTYPIGPQMIGALDNARAVLVEEREEPA